MRPQLIWALRRLGWLAGAAPRSEPRFWVVKGRPDRNDFEAWLEPGRDDTWVTMRPPREWARGDRLFFWKAAPALAVVGLGLLRSSPRRYAGRQARFDVRYLTGYLAHPVHITLARRQPALRNASFLKSGPAGTVFPLSRSEASVLHGLVVRRNPECAGIWSEFSAPTEVEIPPDLDETPPGGTEGRRRLVRHFIRERNRVLIHEKRKSVLAKTGRLACEICGFDFAARYGLLGRGFCEVHHRAPLGALTRVRRTELADLAVVCSNCHRMIHRDGTVRSVTEVRRTLK